MKIQKKHIVLIAVSAFLMLLSLPLLNADSAVFFRWWLAVLILGIAFYPLAAMLFPTLADKGWIFSKAVGIAVAGFTAYVLITCGAAGFDSIFVILCTAALAALCWILYAGKKKRASVRTGADNRADLTLILTEELLFLSLFLLWTYLAGCRPEAHGTEKFMDYGFMAAMMRDARLPARDMWYSAGRINYYFGGQYYAVWLTRLTGTRINETYNLMRTLVAAFAFVLPFNLVWHLLRERKEGAGKGVAYTGGIFSGAAVSLAGNMHYVFYGLFGSVFRLSGWTDYWFPSSTRYIGHNPLTDYDQCIHEFPSYSFVLGDLHAHVVNIIFVLCFLGILYAWFRKKERQFAAQTAREMWTDVLKEPHLWMMGLLLGIFQWTNYWDFIIYLTVGIIGFGLLFFRHREKTGFAALLVRIAVIAGAGCIAAVPFNMHFSTMAQGVGISPHHSAFYQMAILWGLPVVSVALLFVFAVRRNRKVCAAGEKRGFVANLTLSDMTALLLGICALGLILIPELIYVRDIYEENYARCNTMFKLTYQAYIMFGMSMIYSLFRLLADVRKIIVRIISAFLIFCFLLTCGYFPYSVSCWFGDVGRASAFRCLDATAYLENTFPEDAPAIRWLQENVEGNPVVLEADGDSYSDYERVSAMTGLPTVVGWFVHEWLWRNDSQDLVMKSQDVRLIYTSTDEAEVKELIRKYEVEYIFIGTCEREMYPDMNETLLNRLGNVAFAGEGENAAYIIQINGWE